MSRIYPYIACILLAIALGWSVKSHIETKQQYKKLQHSIVAFNKANQESVKVITEIREKIKQGSSTSKKEIKYVKVSSNTPQSEKDSYNCYNVNIPDAIIDRVHHNK